jgi:ATP-dependent helicase HepA
MFAFVKGDEVVLVARPQAGVGVVVDVINVGTEPQFRVRFPSGASIYSGRALELSTDNTTMSSDPIDLLRAGEFSSAEDFRTFMTLAKLEKPLADNLYSFAASRTERLPHQFKPVLKLLANPYGRLLIADEVGLGKTIEAGIILAELGSRQPLDNVLVVCPSALTEKWRSEMRDRFLMDFDVLDSARLREFLRTDLGGPAPLPSRLIGSLELLRRSEMLEALGTSAPQFDAVIVDEAHHMRNASTSSNTLGEVLGRLGEVVVFLTATPLNLDRADFYQLMHLLVPEEFPSPETFSTVIEPNAYLNAALRHLRAGWPPRFDLALRELRGVERLRLGRRFLASPRYQATRDLLERGSAGVDMPRSAVVQAQRDLLDLNTLSHVFTRTRKREVQELFPTRRSATVAVTFTPDEMAFYDAVTAWVLERYAGPVAHLVAATFQRLAASCLPALGARLVQTFSTGQITIDVDEASELIDDGLSDVEDLDGAFTDGSVDIDVEPSATQELMRAWGAYRGSHDSKYDGFAEALTHSFSEGATRILTFSYFRGTIDYLAERLSRLAVGGEPLQVLKLYGPMTPDERAHAVTTFQDTPRPVVLLSSEVGSEGLDFQFCSRMFNYDLPWNPMRVEQRIGRLDRYGQTSKVIHILNMIVSDTIEERIFYRLYERIRIFESSIGDLEAILGEIQGNLTRLHREALSGDLTESEIERRTNQIADVIIRRQLEDDAFETESKQFLSNDDVFLDIFNDIARARRYITPEELQALVEGYLSDCDFRVGLAPAGDRPGIFILNGDLAKLRVIVARALGRSAANPRIARAFVARIPEHEMDVTFDPRLATADRRLEFVSLHHPLVHAAAAQARNHATLARCTSIRAALRLEPGATYGFFVYELQAHGVKDELELTAVVVDANGSVVYAGRELLTHLERADSEALAVTPETVETMYDASLSWAQREVQTREGNLRIRNDETVSAQVESLRISTDRRRLWLRQQLAEGTSMPILRMHRAQLTRIDAELETRLDVLERKRGVTVSYVLLAAGLVAASNRV